MRKYKTLGFGVDKYLNKYYTMVTVYMIKYKSGGKMKNLEFCLGSHGRYPVRCRPALGLEDPQNQPPTGWCGRCGVEVYRRGARYCRGCRQGTERSIYEVCESL